MTSYSYTSYGELMPNSPQPTVFGFNGEATDYDAGIQYLRARCYDPSIGRFFQEDDAKGSFTEPLTMNRNAYVGNNPVNRVDPSGYGWLKDKIKAAGQAISNAATKVVTTTKAVVKATVRAVRTTATRVVKTVAKTYNAVRSTVKSTYNYAKNTVKRTITAIKKTARKAVNKVATTVKKVYKKTKSVVSKTVKKIKEKVVTAVKDIGQAAINKVKEIGNNIKNFVGNTWNTVSNAVANAWNAVSSAAVKTWNAISDAAASAWDWMKSAYNTVCSSKIGQWYQNCELAQMGASMGVGFIPVVGDIKDMQEAITGVDLITGEELSTGERWLSGGLAGVSIILAICTLGASEIIPLNSLDEIIEGGTYIAKNADEIKDFVKGGDKAIDALGEAGEQLTRNADEIGEVIQNGACFVAGTVIVTILGDKSIEEIKVGDRVLSENPETGEQEYKLVVNTFVRETTTIIEIEINDEIIETTLEHPFWIEGKGWIRAKYLKTGDVVRLSDGKNGIIENIAIVYLDEPIQVYNFEVEDFHTYYVADIGVLVHNSCSVDNLVDIDESYFKNLDKKFEKHVIKKEEFGDISKQEYFNDALELATRPSDAPNTIIRELSDGRTGVYDTLMDELVIVHDGSNIGSYYAPIDGISYFNNMN